MTTMSTPVEPPQQLDAPPGESGPAQRDGRQNVGDSERKLSVAAGSCFAAIGLLRGNLAGLALAGVGAALIQRGVTGQCKVYSALQIDTKEEPSEAKVQRDLATRGIHVEQAMLIDRPAADLYRFWRELDNLPSFMRHLKSVQVQDEKRSHWVTEAPAITGGSMEWDAEITRDEPDTAIAWRSLPGSDIDTAGEIRFTRALGDRGTEVHVSMEYLPPAGKVGHWIATLFGDDPRQQMRDDLHNFKALMEVGEVPSIKGQPHGTCLGRGKRAESEPQ